MSFNKYGKSEWIKRILALENDKDEDVSFNKEPYDIVKDFNNVSFPFIDDLKALYGADLELIVIKSTLLKSTSNKLYNTANLICAYNVKGVGHLLFTRAKNNFSKENEYNTHFGTAEIKLKPIVNIGTGERGNLIIVERDDANQKFQLLTVNDPNAYTLTRKKVKYLELINKPVSYAFSNFITRRDPSLQQSPVINIKDVYFFRVEKDDNPRDFIAVFHENCDYKDPATSSYLRGDVLHLLKYNPENEDVQLWIWKSSDGEFTATSNFEGYTGLITGVAYVDNGGKGILIYNSGRDPSTPNKVYRFRKAQKIVRRINVSGGRDNIFELLFDIGTSKGYDISKGDFDDFTKIKLEPYTDLVSILQNPNNVITSYRRSFTSEWVGSKRNLFWSFENDGDFEMEVRSYGLRQFIIDLGNPFLTLLSIRTDYQWEIKTKNQSLSGETTFGWYSYDVQQKLFNIEIVLDYDITYTRSLNNLIAELEEQRVYFTFDVTDEDVNGNIEAAVKTDIRREGIDSTFLRQYFFTKIKQENRASLYTFLYRDGSWKMQITDYNIEEDKFTKWTEQLQTGEVLLNEDLTSLKVFKTLNFNELFTIAGINVDNKFIVFDLFKTSVGDNINDWHRSEINTIENSPFKNQIDLSYEMRRAFALDQEDTLTLFLFNSTLTDSLIMTKEQALNPSRYYRDSYHNTNFALLTQNLNFNDIYDKLLFNITAPVSVSGSRIIYSAYLDRNIYMPKTVTSHSLDDITNTRFFEKTETLDLGDNVNLNFTGIINVCAKDETELQYPSFALTAISAFTRNRKYGFINKQKIRFEFENQETFDFELKNEIVTGASFIGFQLTTHFISKVLKSNAISKIVKIHILDINNNIALTFTAPIWENHKRYIFNAKIKIEEV